MSLFGQSQNPVVASLLQVRGPMLVVDSTGEGGIHGLRQSSGPVGFGFFIGIRLRDYGAFAELVDAHFTSG